MARRTAPDVVVGTAVDVDQVGVYNGPMQVVAYTDEGGPGVERLCLLSAIDGQSVFAYMVRTTSGEVLFESAMSPRTAPFHRMLGQCAAAFCPGLSVR